MALRASLLPLQSDHQQTALFMDLSFLMSFARRTPLLNSTLMWWARQYSEDSIVTIRSGLAKGMRWRRSHRYISAYWLGYYELEIQSALQRELKPGYTFFDVGANAGFFTLLGAQLVGPAGKVIAFEPLPENADCIRFQLKLNSITWCEVVEEAVGASEGAAAFSYDTAGSSVGHLGASSTTEKRISVRASTLDRAASRFGSPQFIKMDIEGAEAEALKGAPELLKLNAGWLIELHGPSPEEGVKAMLGANGYGLHTLGGKQLDASAVLPRHVLARRGLSQHRPG